MESQGGERSTRWRVEAALAVLFVVVMLMRRAGRAVWMMSRKPIHEDAAAVPSSRLPRPPTGMRLPWRNHGGSRAHWPPVTICRAFRWPWP